MSYNYLASPYSHRDPDVMDERYNLACEAIVWLMERSIWTYSPIVHCHEIAKRYDMPRNSLFWKKYNQALLKEAAGFFILTIPGWDESMGVEEETHYAAKHKILTKFIHRTDKGIFTIRSTQ